MSYILYHSNLCEHSKKLLQKISKMDIRNIPSIHYVCVDKRVKENGKTYVELDNGQRMIMPPTITEVPALMCVSQGFKIVYGNGIYSAIDSIRPTNSNSNSSTVSSNQPQTQTQPQTQLDGYYSSNSLQFGMLDGTGDGQNESWENSYNSSSVIQK